MGQNYEEMNREDFVPGGENQGGMTGIAPGMEIPVAQSGDEEANNMLPESVVEDDENYLKIKFFKPYSFEGEVFKGVDLSGLDDINGRQLTAIEKAFAKTGIASTMPETTNTYAKIAATAATGLPAEFFEELPGRELRKIRSALTRFFYEED